MNAAAKEAARIAYEQNMAGIWAEKRLRAVPPVETPITPEPAPPLDVPEAVPRSDFELARGSAEDLAELAARRAARVQEFKAQEAARLHRALVPETAAVAEPAEHLQEEAAGNGGPAMTTGTTTAPAIPADLTELDQWVLYRTEERGGKPTKVPYQPNGKAASSTDFSTWSSHKAAVEALRASQQRGRPFDGIGFVLTVDDPLTGIDLDHCLDDDGQPKSWARPIIEKFGDTYIEVSPSGRGLHIFCRAKLPGNGKKAAVEDGAVEMYDQGRYFTVSGNVYRNDLLERGVEEHQRDVEALYRQIAGDKGRGPRANLHHPAKWEKGDRHDHLMSVAGQYRAKGMERTEILAALKAVNAERCSPPKSDDELVGIADWVCQKPNESAAKAAVEVAPSNIMTLATSGEVPNLIPWNLTDSGNGERLIAFHHADVRFCVEMQRWLTWDGRRWCVDDQNVIRRFAVRTMRQTYAQAAEVTDRKFQETLEGHARKSESAAGVTNMVTQAKLVPGICVHARDLDTDPWLLNCQNGTLDLRTNTLRPARREDLITKLSPVEFDPDARCDVFLGFLRRILDNRENLISYLQRAFGYSLTGLVTEKAVFCLFGEGDNGKTSLLETFRYVLGDYSTQVLIDSLMTKQQETNASLADLVDLRGARFVTTSEAEEGQRLSEGKLKYLTGMNEIKSCRKYENYVTFVPTHKIFLDANHRPLVRGTDRAIWARLKPLPFTVRIPKPEQDKELLDKLKAEAAGILTWAAWGCADWRRDGLGDPLEIDQETCRWKAENDPLGDFIEDRCVLDAAAFVRSSDLWAAYQRWADTEGEKHTLSRPRFGERLLVLGCQPAKRSIGGTQQRCWLGVGLKDVTPHG